MATFELIASAQAGSGGTTNFDFQNILPNWTDLCIKLSARTTDLNSITVDISLNNSTSNFTTVYLQGAGSGNAAYGSLARFAGQGVGSSFTSNTFSNGEIYIPNYLSTVAKTYSADTVTVTSIELGLIRHDKPCTCRVLTIVEPPSPTLVILRFWK